MGCFSSKASAAAAAQQQPQALPAKGELPRATLAAASAPARLAPAGTQEGAAPPRSARLQDDEALRREGAPVATTSAGEQLYAELGRDAVAEFVSAANLVEPAERHSSRHFTPLDASGTRAHAGGLSDAQGGSSRGGALPELAAAGPELHEALQSLDDAVRSRCVPRSGACASHVRLGLRSVTPARGRRQRDAAEGVVEHVRGKQRPSTAASTSHATRVATLACTDRQSRGWRGLTVDEVSLL